MIPLALDEIRELTRQTSDYESPMVQSGNLAPIWVLPWEQIKDLSKPDTLGNFSLSDDKWIIDFEHVKQASINKADGSRTLDFSIINNSFDDAELEGFKRRFKRIIWLLLNTDNTVMATRIKTGKSVLSAISKLATVYVKPMKLKDHCPDGHPFFAAFSHRSFEKAIPKSNRTLQQSVASINKLDSLVEDTFFFSVTTARPKTENINSLEPFSDPDFTHLLDSLQTISQYTDLAIDLAIWLSKVKERVELGQFQPYFSEKGYSDRGELRPKGYQYDVHTLPHKQDVLEPLKEKYPKLINEDGALVHGDFFKKHINLGTIGTVNFKSFVNTIEAANKMLISYLTGCRDNEINGLEIDCLQPVPNADFTAVLGYDFKNNDFQDGEPIDFPMPNLAVNIIEKQQILRVAVSSLFEASHRDDKLFITDAARTNTFTKILNNIEISDPNMGFLLKRMRTTALSHVLIATRSPLVAQTVAGHVNFEQTSAYYKARGSRDSSIYDEIREQERRFNTKLGKEIFADIKTGSSTQKLTQSVLKSLGSYVQHVSDAPTKDEKTEVTDEKPIIPTHVVEARAAANDPETIEDTFILQYYMDKLDDEPAEYIGKNFNVASPGVLCAATKGDFVGACTPNVGETEPSNCKFSCQYNHRTLKGLKDSANYIRFYMEQMLEITKKDPDCVDDPRYYYRANTILEHLDGFEGPLAEFKNDLKLITLLTPIAESEIINELEASKRRTLLELVGA